MVTLHRYPAQQETLAPPRSFEFSNTEFEKLNQLVGMALTNRNVCHKLIVTRDASLRDEFGLSNQTWQYIHASAATSLEELCQNIIEVRQRFIY